MGRCSWVEKQSDRSVAVSRSVPGSIRQRWGNEDTQEWGNLWHWHCGGTAWSGGVRITYNLCQFPVGSENTSASLEGGREGVTWVARWPCLKPCQAVVGLKAELRVFTARPGLFFFPSCSHFNMKCLWSHSQPKKNSSSWILVSEVERIAWSSFHTPLPELLCPLLNYTWVFKHILPHFINQISFFGQ